MSSCFINKPIKLVIVRLDFRVPFHNKIAMAYNKYRL